jgi:hypothetical protein
MDRGTDIGLPSPRAPAKHLVRWARVVCEGRPEGGIPYFVHPMRGTTAACFFAEAHAP